MAQFFCSSLFQILKKAYLRISKYLAQFFCSSPFQILKKHTYESQNTHFHTNNNSNNNFKGNNLHKTIIQTIPIETIIQIDKHKVKYIITACIHIILIKIFLLFIKKSIII